jgi:CBS domain containing-hemolysin-like protein
MQPGTIIIVCLILSAFFAGMEIAFVSANRLRIELDKKQGSIFSWFVNVFVENPSQYIVTILILNNVVLVIYGIEMAIILKPLINQLTTHEYTVLIIQTIISTTLILVTAEFLPKAIFRVMPNVFLNYLSIPTFFFFITFYPLARVVMWISQVLIKWVTRSRSNRQNEMYVFGKVDLNHLVHDLGDKGKRELDTEHEIRIFRNALDFSSVKVRDCMAPRTDVVAVDDESSVDELRQQFIETGFSKIPIYEKNIDNIIGYISSKDLFKNPQDIKSKIIRAPIVPETMNASRLLRILMQERKSLAVVVDEFGGTSGIVTTEDIMEEIFGEIEDEHDTDEIVEKDLKENSYIFSGKLEIEYLNKTYHLSIHESSEYETLAGFIIHTLGRIPSVNEQFIIEQFEFRVLKVNNNRLELIYITLNGK